MSVSVKIGSTWRNVDQLYIKIGGVWRKVSNVFTKVSGQWKPSYSYSWSVGAWSACSVSCGGGTQSRVVTCVRNDGKTVEDSLCGSKPVTSQVCNAQACQPVGDCRYSIAGSAITNWYFWSIDNSGWNNGVWSDVLLYPDSFFGPCFQLDSTPCTYQGYRYTKGAFVAMSGSTAHYQICRVPV